MNKLNFRVSLLVALAGLVACDGVTTVGSSTTSSNDFFAEIHVTETSTKTVTVEAQIRKGGPSGDYILLEGDDQLIVAIDSKPNQVQFDGDLFQNISQVSTQQKRLSPGEDVVFNFFGISILQGVSGRWYTTSFDSVDPNAEYTVSLLRPKHVSMPDSTVTLPSGFEITQPVSADGALYSRSLDDIVVDWGPAGTTDTMTMAAIITCQDGSSDTWTQSLVGDGGNYTITAGTFSGLSGNCTASINLQRTAPGQLDPAYGKGGIIVGHQSRTVLVNTID